MDYSAYVHTDRSPTAHSLRNHETQPQIAYEQRLQEMEREMWKCEKERLLREVALLRETSLIATAKSKSDRGKAEEGEVRVFWDLGKQFRLAISI